MKNVCILMSTYNGEKYLREQIESLRNQQGVDAKILVRDDGSNDSTTQILEQYSKEGVLEWYAGENLKSARSFLDLIYHTPYSDYYAFCDQDDYWMPNKLAAAIQLLEETDSGKSALYCSKTKIVDKDLHPIDQKNKFEFMALGMPSAFIINNAPGCTMVFNRYLLERVREYVPAYIGMHDSWIYKVCVVTGNQIIADKNAYIYYRQHGNNVLGGMHNPIKSWKRRINNLQSASCYRSKVANQVLIGYEKYLSEGDGEILRIISNYKKNIRYWILAIINPSISTPIPFYTLMFKVAVMLRVF